MNQELLFGGLAAVAMVCIVAIVAVVFGRGFKGELTRDRFTVETDPPGSTEQPRTDTKELSWQDATRADQEPRR